VLNRSNKTPRLFCGGFTALSRTRTGDRLLTILVQAREARARAGPRGRESPASRRDLTRRRDPRVDGFMFASCSHEVFANKTTAH
jgi:hypothetical protein